MAMAVDVVHQGLLDETLRRCREWLTYQSPSRRKRQVDAIVVPAMRYDELAGRGSGTVGLGPYRIVLSEAQFHWAATTLPPLLRDAAFRRRTHRDIRRVSAHCYQSHRREWLHWCAEHSDRPILALLEECAVQMAEKLGGDLI